MIINSKITAVNLINAIQMKIFKIIFIVKMPENKEPDKRKLQLQLMVNNLSQERSLNCEKFI